MSEKGVQKEVEDRFEKINRDAMSEKINQSFELLVESVKKDPHKLPEDIFVNYFLPFFCGERQITKETPVMAEWIGVSGAPTAEVSIIDQKGNVLFIVPALFDSSIVERIERKPGDSFADIYSEYELRAQTIPAVGRNYLREAIESKLRTITKESETLSENAQRWVAIFDRYGKINPTQKSPSGDKNKDSLADDIVYE